MSNIFNTWHLIIELDLVNDIKDIIKILYLKSSTFEIHAAKLLTKNISEKCQNCSFYCINFTTVVHGFSKISLIRNINMKCRKYCDERLLSVISQFSSVNSISSEQLILQLQ